MNAFASIIATVNRPHLLQQLVEKLAQGRPLNVQLRIANGRWSLAGTSTVETYTDGCLAYRSTDGEFRLAFATPFLFTCVDRQNQGVALAWSQSLS